MAAKRLTKSSTDRKLAGVCGGLGRYLEVDSTWVRLVFVLLLFAGGTGLIVYIVMAIVVPVEDTVVVEGTAAAASPDVGECCQGRATLVFGLGLIVLGTLILAGNLGFFDWWRWDLIWPVLLILGGVALLAKRSQR